jgi:hypothetical protein
VCCHVNDFIEFVFVVTVNAGMGHIVFLFLSKIQSLVKKKNRRAIWEIAQRPNTTLNPTKKTEPFLLELYIVNVEIAKR